MSLVQELREKRAVAHAEATELLKHDLTVETKRSFDYAINEIDSIDEMLQHLAPETRADERDEDGENFWFDGDDATEPGFFFDPPGSRSKGYDRDSEEHKAWLAKMVKLIPQTSVRSLVFRSVERRIQED